MPVARENVWRNLMLFVQKMSTDRAQARSRELQVGRPHFLCSSDSQRPPSFSAIANSVEGSFLIVLLAPSIGLYEHLFARVARNLLGHGRTVSAYMYSL